MRILNSDPTLLHERTGLGETPLHYLAVENQIDAVMALVEQKGAEINTVNDFGQSPLYEVATLGHIELVKYFLSKGASLELGNPDDPILHAAVRSNNLEVVKAIVEAGAPINGVNDLKETALHEAARDDARLEIAAFLLQAGAEVDSPAFDESPRDVAEWNGSAQISLMLRNAASQTKGSS